MHSAVRLQAAEPLCPVGDNRRLLSYSRISDDPGFVLFCLENLLLNLLLPLCKVGKRHSVDVSQRAELLAANKPRAAWAQQSIVCSLKTGAGLIQCLMSVSIRNKVMHKGICGRSDWYLTPQNDSVTQQLLCLLCYVTNVVQNWSMFLFLLPTTSLITSPESSFTLIAM